MYELAEPRLLKSITGDPKVWVPPAVAPRDEKRAIPAPPNGVQAGVVPAFATVLLDQVGAPNPPPPTVCQPAGGNAAPSKPCPVTVCAVKSEPKRAIPNVIA